jgi:hypothetical protein
MSSSVQGTVPDQSWATALPGYFKQNIKPNISDPAFLIPRGTLTFPDIVTETTVGKGYDRGFIDRVPTRGETTRHAIENPSTYVMRLHPHDLTSGTGGIDNLSNLYRFGHPLPLADGEDFMDFTYWAGRELQKEANDPLSAGYAVKVLGSRMQENAKADHALAVFREKFRSKYSEFMQKQMAEQKRGKTYFEGDVLLAPEERAARLQAIREAADSLNEGYAGSSDSSFGGVFGVTQGAAESAQQEPFVRAYLSSRFPQPSNSNIANTGIGVTRQSGSLPVGGSSIGRDQVNSNERASNPQAMRAGLSAQNFVQRETRYMDPNLSSQTQTNVEFANSQFFNTIDGNRTNPMQASNLGQNQSFAGAATPGSSSYVFQASSTGAQANTLRPTSVGTTGGLDASLGGTQYTPLYSQGRGTFRTGVNPDTLREARAAAATARSTESRRTQMGQRRSFREL